MNKPENPAAFPQLEAVLGGGIMQPTVSAYGGMTLRDYFAAAALTGVMPDSNAGFRMSWSDYAEAAYAVADAMLAEREKRHD